MFLIGSVLDNSTVPTDCKERPVNLLITPDHAFGMWQLRESHWLIVYQAVRQAFRARKGSKFCDLFCHSIKAASNCDLLIRSTQLWLHEKANLDL